MPIEDCYKLIFEKIPLGCLLLDVLSGDITCANQAACVFFDYRKEKIEKLSWMDLQKCEAPFQMADGQFLAQKYLRSDGSELLFDTSFVLLPSNPPKMLVVLSPCEERLSLQKECLELNRKLDDGKKMRALGQLAGGVAHDYNNMLAIIAGNMELMIRQGVEHAVLEECLATLERAKGLSKQILRFARREGPENTRVLLQESIRRVGHLMGIEFVMITESPLFIMTDPSELDAALVNFLSNAKESAGENGKIWLKLEELQLKTKMEYFRGTLTPGDYALIIISDNGMGIPKELHERLFEPYFTTKPYKGMGLGLARVGAYVESMNGAIGLDTAEGYGTQWQIVLPLNKNTGIEFSKQLLENPVEKVDHHMMPIAIVDDEPALVKLVGRLLKQEGYRSIGFTHPEEALVGLRTQEAPFVLVTDAKMPGMSGVELVKALRMANRRFLALLMSGYHEELSSDQTLFESCLEKPLGTRALIEALRAAQRKLS